MFEARNYHDTNKSEPQEGWNPDEHQHLSLEIAESHEYIL